MEIEYKLFLKLRRLLTSKGDNMCFSPEMKA